MDATTDSPGMLLVEGNRIKTVALGEFSLQEATDVAKNLLPAAEIDYMDCQGKVLQPGFMADLVLCDPAAQWIVQGRDFFSKGKYTPLEGATLTGKVLATYHGGREVFKAE